MDIVTSLASDFLNTGSQQQIAATANDVRGSFDLLKWLYNGRIVISIFIVVWAIIISIMHTNETDPKKREDMAYINSVAANSCVLISVVWITSILIAIIVPSITSIMKNSLALLAK